jgi:hypothetical protein
MQLWILQQVKTQFISLQYKEDTRLGMLVPNKWC